VVTLHPFEDPRQIRNKRDFRRVIAERVGALHIGFPFLKNRSQIDLHNVVNRHRSDWGIFDCYRERVASCSSDAVVPVFLHAKLTGG
jgi:hypothetical protein